VPTIRLILAAGWIVFWSYWLISALRAKQTVRGSGRRHPLISISALSVILLLRVFARGDVAINIVPLAAAGLAMFACGVGLAIWARIHLGRNWGVPMSRRVEPELITSGPYRYVRHPIYSGLILAILGTALTTSLVGLLLPAALTGYFYYAASVEERNMTAEFPTQYPAYRDRTKRLIPFLL
jgi:protein-S-isoprenylcysteine O-methyltransferase Ste14